MASPELKIICTGAKDKAIREQVKAFAEDNGLTIAGAMRFLLKFALNTGRSAPEDARGSGTKKQRSGADPR